MFKDIGDSIRNFVSPPSDKPKRKRKFDCDVSGGDVGPSPAKRTRQESLQPALAASKGSDVGRLSKITSWISSALFHNRFVAALTHSERHTDDRSTMASRPPRPLTPMPQARTQPNTQHQSLFTVLPPKQPNVVTMTFKPQKQKSSSNITSPAGQFVSPRLGAAGRYHNGGYRTRFEPPEPPRLNFSRSQHHNDSSFPVFPPSRKVGESVSERTPSSYTRNDRNVKHSMHEKLFGPKEKRIGRKTHKQAVKESVRLKEKDQYMNLIKQYTRNSPLVQGHAEVVKVTNIFAAGVSSYQFNGARPKSQLKPSNATLRTPQQNTFIDLTEDVKTIGPKTTGADVKDIGAKRMNGESANYCDLTKDDDDVRARLHDVRSKHLFTNSKASREVIDLSQDVDVLTPAAAAAESRPVNAGARGDAATTVHDDILKCAEAAEAVRSYPCSPTNERLKKELTQSKYATTDWIHDLQERFSKSSLERERIKHYEIQHELMKEKKEEWEADLERSLRRSLALSQRQPPVIEETFIELIDSDEEEETGVDEFPALTEEEEAIVSKALVPRPPQQMLTEGFKLQLTRADFATLGGLNWLNDEVINFYMNMLMERGESDNSPSVHAFNTFFYPKLMSNGHAGVKRWTKRGNIDIFAKDYVLIPVHLGMHWCLAVIDFTKKEIRYYDSMGGNNNACLNALKQYLEDESMDKKKQAYSTADWSLINVKDIPQQMNGSDCGMFTCKFAEYVSRGAAITFSQEHMPYFRRRMVLELLNKKFMT